MKMSTLSKLIYKFKQCLLKSHQDFLEIDKIILKCLCKNKGTKIAKTILEKNKVGSIILPDFRTYYIATVIKNVW